MRHSQYLIGAGLGSANSNRVRSATERHQLQGGIALAGGCQPVDFGERTGFHMSGRKDTAVRAIAQRVHILRIFAGQDGEIVRAPP